MEINILNFYLNTTVFSGMSPYRFIGALATLVLVCTFFILSIQFLLL
ncbi:hypothetical protein SLW70_07445 [Flavobacterium sp. NG2]|nr:hypothetical protein [Flavobacterium sp. NG2]WPR72945.1 hypothetical protein SLW70_07445 [Flavobacterium sp. NG2]